MVCVNCSSTVIPRNMTTPGNSNNSSVTKPSFLLLSLWLPSRVRYLFLLLLWNLDGTNKGWDVPGKYKWYCAATVLENYYCNLLLLSLLLLMLMLLSLLSILLPHTITVQVWKLLSLLLLLLLLLLFFAYIPYFFF